MKFLNLVIMFLIMFFSADSLTMNPWEYPLVDLGSIALAQASVKLGAQDPDNASIYKNAQLELNKAKNALDIIENDVLNKKSKELEEYIYLRDFLSQYGLYPADTNLIDDPKGQAIAEFKKKVEALRKKIAGLNDDIEQGLKSQKSTPVGLSIDELRTKINAINVLTKYKTLKNYRASLLGYIDAFKKNINSISLDNKNQTLNLINQAYDLLNQMMTSGKTEDKALREQVESLLKQLDGILSTSQKSFDIQDYINRLQKVFDNTDNRAKLDVIGLGNDVQTTLINYLKTLDNNIPKDKQDGINELVNIINSIIKNKLQTVSHDERNVISRILKGLYGQQESKKEKEEPKKEKEEKAIILEQISSIENAADKIFDDSDDDQQDLAKQLLEMINRVKKDVQLGDEVFIKPFISNLGGALKAVKDVSVKDFKSIMDNLNKIYQVRRNLVSWLDFSKLSLGDKNNVRDGINLLGTVINKKLSLPISKIQNDDDLNLIKEFYNYIIKGKGQFGIANSNEYKNFKEKLEKI